MAKSVLFLHIGTPKTGTSAIQLFLVTNREALEKKGWTYPDFGFVYPDASETRNALWLAREMDPSDDENRKKAMPQLLSAAEQFPHMILSEESLWTQGGYCSEGREHFWRTFASFLKENDIDLKIIVYLRRQDQYLYSYWAQKVKKRDETRLFRQFAEEFGLAHTKLDYCAQLDLIAEGVGAENMIVRPYDRSRFENGSIVYDFLGIVGLTPDDGFEFPEESNSSMSDCVLEAKRLMNRSLFQNRSTGFLYSSLWEVQREFEQEGKLKRRNAFSSAERKKFLRAYEKTNEETARRYVYPDAGADQIPPLFPTDDLDREYEEWTFSVEEIADVYNRCLFVANRNGNEKILKLQQKNRRLQKRNKNLREKVLLERWRQSPMNRMKEKMGKSPQIRGKKKSRD